MSDTNSSEAPAAGDELAQGTPVEPAAPVAGDLVEHEETGRLGIVTGDALVLWLGVPERCELPLRKVG